MENAAIRLQFLLEIFFYFFIFSFFLTLGTDFYPQVIFRIWYGAILLAAFLILSRGKIILEGLKNPVVVLLLIFLGFEIVRSLGAIGIIHTSASPANLDIVLFKYQTSPIKWSLYVGVFILSFSFFKSKTRAARLLWLVACTGFFMALNAIPPLISSQKSVGYYGGDGKSGFFYPIFYFLEPVTQYLFGRVYQENYTGDVMVLGFFPALGIFFYTLQTLKDKKSALPEAASVPISSLGLMPVFASAIALVAITLNSRGTIISLLFVFLLFLLGLTTKFFSGRQLSFSILVFLVIFGIVYWAGNLGRTLKEVQTLKSEIHPEGHASFLVNIEASKRALAIHHAYPVWGAGTEGYPLISERYASPDTLKNEDYVLADIRAMSHYLHILAEEGMGAYIYFLFLMVYFVSIANYLFRIKSRFQFMAGLSLFSSAAVIFVHALIGHLMQQFSIAMLVYIFMGASLGIVSSDFEHA